MPSTENIHSHEVAVVGAGLVGRLLAWRLLTQGKHVTLIEQTTFNTPASAAHTAAAMISPMSEVVVSERSVFDMGMQSLAMWPLWLDELNTAPGSPVQYHANGSVVVAHAADASELQQFYSDLSYHLGTDNNARWLDRQELREVEPDIAGQFECALYLPGEAYLDNRALLTALLDRIRDMGGVCIEQQTVTFSPAPSAEGLDFTQFDAVVDCRGIGARQSQTQLRGVRGEVLWVETPEVHLNHPVRLMHPRYKLYIVPKPNHRFIIGATEIESQDRSPVSVQSMLELCSALYTLNPAFAEARITELDANLRPSFFDNLPLVEEQTLTSGQRPQRIVRINGLYRHGYLLAPTLVQQALAYF